MKRLALIFMAALAFTVACSEKEGGSDAGSGTGGPLTVDFTISANPCLVGQEIELKATVAGGVSPYTFTWELGSDIKLEGQEVKYTFDANGSYITVLTVVDKSGKKVVKRKNLVVNPAEVPEQGTVNLLWANKVTGYNAWSAPAIADDGSIYATTQSNILYKYDKDGKLLWEKKFNHTVEGAGTQGTPSIDADGTVYIGTGSANGAAKVYALNPDGSEKWVFSDFWCAPTQVLSPSFFSPICGIGESNIYFGNCGTAGTMIAADKATGNRVAWMQNEKGGGPAGGVRAGVVITKEGMLHWGGGKYGFFGVAKNTVDGANNSGVMWNWQVWNAEPDAPANNNQGALGIATIGGKTCIVGVVSDVSGYGPKVYAMDSATGEAVSTYRVEDSPAMDNGSVAVTSEGYIVATLNFSNGQSNGGIVLVNPTSPEGKKVAEYRVQEKVSCTPAIDAAGNIHFATESGNYYVVDKDCKLVVKKKLKEMLLADDRYKEAFAKLDAAKVWSSPVIGDDGKIYLQFTNNDAAKKREFGAIVCMQIPECTAPGNTDWPMIGQNRRHTNCQK
ncbi:MAG: hypothetical protein E7123_03360 [Bacteroidales bacterium]|nr:hypothetical protein [Bacteroidales bacterium]